MYITSAVQELTSKLACLLLTNRPSWTRRRERIGDSDKRENAGTLGRRSARTKPDSDNVPAIIGGGHQPVSLVLANQTPLIGGGVEPDHSP